MVVVWPLPVYRHPVWLETVVANFIQQLQSEYQRIVSSNETIVYWLNHPCRNLVTTSTITIAVSILWILCSFFSSWNTKRAAASQRGLQVPLKATVAIQFSPDHSIDNQDDAATAHTPSILPSRHDGLDYSLSDFGRHVPFRVGKIANVRTSRVSTPRYQIPFVSSSEQRNFSHLKQSAPVTYATLRQNGLIHEDGTPTKNDSAHPKKEEVKTGFDSPTRSPASRGRFHGFSLVDPGLGLDDEYEDEAEEEEPEPAQ